MNAKNILVKDVMIPNLFTATEDMLTKELEKYFNELDIQGCPVAGVDGQIIGWISDRDMIFSELSWTRRHIGQETPSMFHGWPYFEGPHIEDYNPVFVGQVMHRKVIKILSSDNLLTALKKMTKEHVHNLMVFDQDKLIGLLVIEEVLEYILKNHFLDIACILDCPTGQLMTTSIAVIREDDTVEDLEELLCHKKIHGVPVIDYRGHIKGVVSQVDIVRFEASTPHRENYPESAETRVCEIMTPVVTQVTSSDKVRYVVELMLQKNIHRVVIAEQGVLKGILTGMDIIQGIVNLFNPSKVLESV